MLCISNTAGLPVLLTEESEAVLLGAAILAAKSSEPDSTSVCLMEEFSMWFVYNTSRLCDASMETVKVHNILF